MDCSTYLCKMASGKQNIRDLTLDQLEKYFLSIGEKKFRAKQVYDWLWLKPVREFDAMTNISKELREKLAENFSFPSITVDTTQHSEDGTLKTRFRTTE